MQRLISKFGLAAHLAILAVAPLFLFPFCREEWIARVLLWLSLYAAIWMLMAPSRHTGEALHEARARVISSLVHDPLFWVMVIFTVFAYLSALNAGVGMTYDAEAGDWLLAAPSVSCFLGCVAGKGTLPFATAVAALVLVQGCRQALGKSARQAFAFVSSCLAGVAALAVTIYAVSTDAPIMVWEQQAFLDPTFIGVAFGLYFLASLAALVGLFELKWKLATPLILFAIGGTAIGLFHFAPAVVVLAFAGVAGLLLAYSLTYVGVKIGGTVVPKCLVLLIVALLVPVLFVIGFTPSALTSGRMEAVFEPALFPADFPSLRATLGSIAGKVWTAYPWRGSGIGSFGLDIRFTATPEDWAVVKLGQNGAVNGWWQILAERGIIGMVMLLLPFLFLLWTWVERLGKAVVAQWSNPSWRRWLLLIHPIGMLGLLAVGLVAMCGLVEHSFERPETLLATVAFFALAGSSFSVVVKSADGSGREVKTNG